MRPRVWQRLSALPNALVAVAQKLIVRTADHLTGIWEPSRALREAPEERAETGGATGLSDGRPIRAPLLQFLSRSQFQEASDYQSFLEVLLGGLTGGATGLSVADNATLAILKTNTALG